MPKLSPQFIKDFSAGMITNVNENIKPENSMRLIVNMDADEEFGSLVVRLGTVVIGSQIGVRPILGLHHHISATGGSENLFAVVGDTAGDNNDIWEMGTNPVKSLEDDTFNLKTRFVTFLDETLRLNGTDAPKAWNGSSWITTGGAFDLDNMPTGHKYVIEWLDRVYMAGNSSDPDRVVYSSTPVDGAVSWVSGNGKVDIEKEDGSGNITGFGKVPGYLLIFKERNLKRWNFYSADPENLLDIGTLSQESVINAGGLCAFFCSSTLGTRGFYVTDGGRPIPISYGRAKNVKKFVDAMRGDTWQHIAGWGDDNHFYWSAGDVTVEGRTFKNVVFRWSVKTGEWVLRTYPSQFRVFAKYVPQSGSARLVGGDDDGNVIQLDRPSTYDDYPSKPILWEVESHEEDFGYNQIKEVFGRIVINQRRLQGKASLIIDGREKNPVPVGSLKGEISDLILPKKVRGQRFVLRLSGQTAGESDSPVARGTLKEIEVPNVEVTENYS